MNLKLKILNIKPPKIATAYLLIMYGVRILAGEYLLAAVPFRIAGIMLFFGGFGLLFSSILLFRKHETVLRPTETPKALVTEGPFRFTRNPIYIGMACMLAGVSLVIGSALMLAAPVLFLITMDQVFVPHEEQVMSGLFGSAYDRYKQSTRRWI